MILMFGKSMILKEMTSRKELHKGNGASNCKLLSPSKVIQTQCQNCLAVYLSHLIVELKLCTLIKNTVDITGKGQTQKQRL